MSRCRAFNTELLGDDADDAVELFFAKSLNLQTTEKVVFFFWNLWFIRDDGFFGLDFLICVSAFVTW